MLSEILDNHIIPYNDSINLLLSKERSIKYVEYWHRKIDEEVNNNKNHEIYIPLILYYTLDKEVYIHETGQRTNSMDYYDEGDEEEMEEDYIVYVNDGTPSIISDDFATQNLEINAKELRLRAKILEKAVASSVIDLTTIVEVCKDLKRKNDDMKWVVVKEYIEKTIETLRQHVNKIDILAYIVHSIKNAEYAFCYPISKKIDKMEILLDESIKKNQEPNLDEAFHIIMELYMDDWLKVKPCPNTIPICSF